MCGNIVWLLVDGLVIFVVMKVVIVVVKYCLFVEFYIVEDEGVVVEVGELLLCKVVEGVSVVLMYDSIGLFGIDSVFFECLRNGGIVVCVFNLVNLLEWFGYWGLI